MHCLKILAQKIADKSCDLFLKMIKITVYYTVAAHTLTSKSFMFFMIPIDNNYTIKNIDAHVMHIKLL